MAMTWLKLGEEFVVEAANADLSDAAFRTHVEGLAWALDRENDGLFSVREVRRFAESPDASAAVKELLDAGFWAQESPTEIRIVHHMAEQPSAANLADRRHNNAIRQRRKRELDALTAQGHTPESAERVLAERGIPAPKVSRRESRRDKPRDETRDPERSGAERNGSERSSFEEEVSSENESETAAPVVLSPVQAHAFADWDVEPVALSVVPARGCDRHRVTPLPDTCRGCQGAAA